MVLLHNSIEKVLDLE